MKSSDQKQCYINVTSTDIQHIIVNISPLQTTQRKIFTDNREYHLNTDSNRRSSTKFTNHWK
ncbi:hypothetical protein T4B_12920 [Trichinella pseudospiralis]|uniref:Uncharacterized protein n=1 Tax=Trichinella pseudospiralis TaxID=6337 RepID=A0A0V1ISX1_TRIPS|nr:hypothetical protein T4B_12920 [Trichinella pseudospiralis]